MKTSTLSFTAALVVFAGFCAFAGIEASGAQEPRPQLQERHVARAAVDEVSSDAPRDPVLDHLSSYVFEVMNSWPVSVIPSANYMEISDDIAAVVLEKPSAEPHVDAVWLATLGFWEGARYARYVDQNLCNDKDWRKHGVEDDQFGQRHRAHDHGLTFSTTIWSSEELMQIGGDCDGGLAHGLGQVHAGWVMDGQLVTAERLRDRRFMFRAMLWLARADPSLCAYAGEPTTGGCPKAELRRQWALNALAKHPFPTLPRE